MVWINDKGYDAKSYPVEARGGAICMRSKRGKDREEKIRIAARRRYKSIKKCPVCGSELPPDMSGCPACKWERLV